MNYGVKIDALSRRMADFERGEALKQRMIDFRARNDMTQRECAERCGVSLQTWYSIEKGHQTPSRLTEGKINILINGTSQADVKQESN